MPDDRLAPDYAANAMAFLDELQEVVTTADFQRVAGDFARGPLGSRLGCSFGIGLATHPRLGPLFAALPQDIIDALVWHAILHIGAAYYYGYDAGREAGETSGR